MNFNSIFEELSELYDEAIETESTAENTLEEATTNEYKLVNKQGVAVVKDVFGSKEEAAAYANKHKLTDVKISGTELVDGKYNGNREYGIDKNGNIVNEAAEAPTTEDEEVEIEIVDDASEQLVLECAKCGALTIKDKVDTKIDEETDLANIDEACAFCEETEGYKIIGVLAPYEASDEEDADTEVNVEDEVVEEGLLDLNLPVDVDINADNNQVAVGGATV